jgi:hypothetical protein
VYLLSSYFSAVGAYGVCVLLLSCLLVHFVIGVYVLIGVVVGVGVAFNRLGGV